MLLIYATALAFFATPTAAPVITELAPASGHVTDSVTIVGEHLDGVTEITFNGQPVDHGGVYGFLVNPAGTSIVAHVPMKATTGILEVRTAAGVARSAAEFKVVPLPPPTILRISPTHGGAGTVVTLIGTDFAPDGAQWWRASLVEIGGQPIQLAQDGFAVMARDKILVHVPKNAVSGTFSVTTPFGTGESAQTFTVTNEVVRSAEEIAAAEEKELVLNGTSADDHENFRVELWVSKRTSDADEILASTHPSRVVLTALRDTPADAIAESLRKGVLANCMDAQCGDFGVRQADYVAACLRGHNLKKGMSVELTFLPTSVRVSILGRQVTNAGDKNFADAVLRTFIGSHPASAQMKKDLLAGRTR